jgi:Ca-activated chloride channel family protein
MSKRADNDSIDDWEYNSTKIMEESRSVGAVSKSRSLVTMSAPKAFRSKKIGMAVGGAKDTNNFKANIDNGYLPKLDSITYEGQFYNHYFDTGIGKIECKELFCPSYSSAKRLDIFSKEKEFFLSVGLNSGIDEKDFKRKKLNLVIILDISGSMSGNFDSYYYDKVGNKVENKEKETKKKMTIANEAIVAMLAHLKDNDRVGIALFDHNSYKAKPLRLVGNTDKLAVRDHILALKEQGGTNWSAGYTEGLKLFDDVKLDSDYENRIVFLTDAMPNSGELGKGKLFALAKKASEKGIHTTFIGIGVDFNNNLVEYVSKTKGANYFSVHSSKRFKELLDREFEYMVTPLVYDLELKLSSKKYKIEAVYGSPDAKIATGEIMKINTLFPSSSEDGETKGGVVLLKLKKVGTGSDDIELKVSYSDINGKSFNNKQSIKFNKQEKDYYDNSGIQKAILISDFVTVMKNWLIDARAGCNDNIKWIMQEYPVIMKRAMQFPPKRPIYPTVKTWERKSCKLKISDGYKKLFQTFKRAFVDEMKSLSDDSLEKELTLINGLIKQKTQKFDKKSKDDWQFVQ